MQFISTTYCVQSWYSSFHLPLLEFCSCEVYKEAASCWSSFNGKSTCSCESSSGINLPSSWRKHHRMANNSFRYNERELHIHNCQLQHGGYYVRVTDETRGIFSLYLLHVYVFFIVFCFQFFSVFYSLCLRSVRSEWREAFHIVPLSRLSQAVFFQSFMWACNEIDSIREFV